MGIFRINKTQDYVVMSNHHLRNKNLTLKAKGLLSQMLSLPADWDYTLVGLAHINKESIDAVRTAVWELEREGYIEKTRERDDKGKLGGTIYNIYELPQKNILDPKPQTEKNTNNKIKTDNLNNTNKNHNADNKDKEITKTIKTSGAEQTQTTIKTEIEETAKKLQNSTTPPSNSAIQGNVDQQKKEKENKELTKEVEKKKTKDIYKLKEFIKTNLEYDYLINTYKTEKEEINDIINIILEILNSQRETIYVAGEEYPTEFVKDRFRQLETDHIEHILGCMEKNTTKIKNIKSYLKTVLFNAPTTINSYYKSLIRHHDFETLNKTLHKI